MQIRPNIDYIQVQPVVQEEQKSQSGIILSASPTDVKQKIGIVLAVGNGLPEIQMQSKIGNIVLYQEGSQVEFLVDGKSIFFVREHEVISFLDNDQPTEE